MSKAPMSTTFKVSNVAAATEPLRELPYPEALANFLCGPVESCSRHQGKLVANVYSHPLIATLHGGFATHRPVTLSPDIVWLTITQGFATHINQNAESLRRKFVSHDGQLTIKVRRDDFIKGSPENPWPEVFSEFSQNIHDYIGDAYDLIVADFSTTGPVERAASEVVLLDSMQTYFEYEVYTICGIPKITLEGTVADWKSIASRLEKFSEFGLSWWVDTLRPIIKQFVDAVSGNVDRRFWDSIYKFLGPEGSGSPYVTGWVNGFFPYLRDKSGTLHRNQWIDAPQSRKGPSREALPNTASRAPFKWFVGTPFETIMYEMEFIGGLIGVAQCPDSLSLRPEIGWAVRETKTRTASYRFRPWIDDLDRFSVL
ncbi:MAG: DUF4419 domain-containing protein [Planctomyces sp.]|nr:DUF4419 domain-containing protein [Planctomyces sp.]